MKLLWAGMVQQQLFQRYFTRNVEDKASEPGSRTFVLLQQLPVGNKGLEEVGAGRDHHCCNVQLEALAGAALAKDWR